MKKNIKKKNKAFTLIEMLVSMTLFSFIITVALGSLFMIMKANEKAKIIKLVVNNLNVAMETMSRELRVGSKYCWNYNRTSCNNEGDEIYFKTKDGCDAGFRLNNSHILQRMKNIKDNNGNCTTNASWLDITGDDIEITNLKFNITGIGNNDDLQPRILIRLKGETGRAILGNQKEVFNIQTTVSQRKIEN